MSEIDAIRDVARAVSAFMVAEQLDRGERVRQPRDPGGVYVREVFANLLAADELGLIAIPVPSVAPQGDAGDAEVPTEGQGTDRPPEGDPRWTACDGRPCRFCPPPADHAGDDARVAAVMQANRALKVLLVALAPPPADHGDGSGAGGREGGEGA